MIPSEAGGAPRRPREAAILAALSDEVALRVLATLAERSASVREVAQRLAIPLASCYRHIHRLQEGGLVFVERSAFTPDGKRYELYRATLRRATITLEGGTVAVRCEMNDAAEDRFARLWDAVRNRGDLP